MDEAKQNDGKQDGGRTADCPENVCFQPQLIYGTCIAIPPVFCRIDCNKLQAMDKNACAKMEEEGSRHNGLQDEKVIKHRSRYNHPENKLEEETRDKSKCPLKTGTMAFPAKNAMYYPSQSLEGTVLELYKKESYPEGRGQKRKCKECGSRNV